MSMGEAFAFPIEVVFVAVVGSLELLMVFGEKVAYFVVQFGYIGMGGLRPYPGGNSVKS